MPLDFPSSIWDSAKTHNSAAQPAAPTGSLTSTLRAEDEGSPAPPLAATIDPTEAQAAADQAGPSRPPGTAQDDVAEDDDMDEEPEKDDDSKGLSERRAFPHISLQPPVSTVAVFAAVIVLGVVTQDWLPMHVTTRSLMRWHMPPRYWAPCPAATRHHTCPCSMSHGMDIIEPPAKRVKPCYAEPSAGNGAEFETYSWSQTLGDVSLTVPLPRGVKGRDCDVSIAKDKLRVRHSAQLSTSRTGCFRCRCQSRRRRCLSHTSTDLALRLFGLIRHGIVVLKRCYGF